MDVAMLLMNGALLIATAGASAIAWWQAIAAGRARNAARASEQAAQRAQEEASSALVSANQLAAVRMRAPFAATLTKYGSELFRMRIEGGDTSIRYLQVNADFSPKLTETGLASGEDTTRLISWVAAYATRYNFDRADTKALARDGSLVDARIRLWVQDPETAMAEISADPRVDVSGFAGFEND